MLRVPYFWCHHYQYPCLNLDFKVLMFTADRKVKDLYKYPMSLESSLAWKHSPLFILLAWVSRFSSPLWLPDVTRLVALGCSGCASALVWAVGQYWFIRHQHWIDNWLSERGESRFPTSRSRYLLFSQSPGTRFQWKRWSRIRGRQSVKRYCNDLYGNGCSMDHRLFKR